jgi:hypothetical protein
MFVICLQSVFNAPTTMDGLLCRWKSLVVVFSLKSLLSPKKLCVRLRLSYVQGNVLPTELRFLLDSRTVSMYSHIDSYRLSYEIKCLHIVIILLKKHLFVPSCLRTYIMFILKNANQVLIFVNIKRTSEHLKLSARNH